MGPLGFFFEGFELCIVVVFVAVQMLSCCAVVLSSVILSDVRLNNFKQLYVSRFKLTANRILFKI